LANQINTGRRNIYALFNREDISTDQLYKISKALNINFFEIYNDNLRAELGPATPPGMEDPEKKPLILGEQTMMIQFSVKFPLSSAKGFEEFVKNLNKTAEEHGFSIA